MMYRVFKRSFLSVNFNTVISVSLCRQRIFEVQHEIEISLKKLSTVHLKRVGVVLQTSLKYIKFTTVLLLTTSKSHDQSMQIMM